MTRKINSFYLHLKNLGIAILLAITILNFVYISKKILGNDPCPTIFGIGMAVVVSNSMYPNIQKYDLVIICQQSEYEIGDIITYNDSGIPVTHRIVEIRETENGMQITTQGDANDSKDYPISINQVVGKVVKVVPYVGSIQVFLQDNISLIMLVIGSLILINDLFQDEQIKYKKFDQKE